MIRRHNNDIGKEHIHNTFRHILVEKYQNWEGKNLKILSLSVIQDESTVTENQQGSAAVESWQAGWEEPKCAICLEEFEENDVDDEPIEYLPCGVISFIFLTKNISSNK